MEKTAAYVRDLYKEHANENLIYHTLEHTEGVVKAAEQIADHYQLDETDYLAVYIAAWFHDTGYLSGPPEGHELKGAAMAEEFLLSEQADSELVEKVKECILATRLSAKPESLTERIMADADLYHFGTESFRNSNRNMRKEVELRSGKRIPGGQWRKSAMIMLRQHEFKTDYCRALLQKGKQENIERLEAREEEQQLKKQIKRAAAEEAASAEAAGSPALAISAASGGPATNSGEPASSTTPGISSAAAAGKGKGKGKKDEKRPARGVETMFRTTSVNHLHLSEMADNKAHILLTINSIIVSILVTLLFRKMDDDSKLLIPGLMFLITSLTTIVFAILVTRPNVTSGVFTKEDIRNKTANLLFFGNFHKMDLEDYQWGVRQMMDDADFLYGSMTRDIYNLGVVLGRKYKLLRYAYGFFMVGFIASALSFVFVVLD
ncbi:HD domain-containing protein [Anseongella ginsenosidimutans]|nr:HD domain-containing protein [Anseongella ginsenosidimutans]